MIRILLAVLAVIAVPFVIYFLYDLARRGPDGTGVRNPKDWEQASVLNLGFAGLFLSTALVIWLVATGSGSRDGTYSPARIEGFNPPEATPERSLVED